MAETDSTLGLEIKKLFAEKGIENPIIWGKYDEHNQDGMATFFKGVCNNLGLDLDHPSVEDTPDRLANMYRNEICWGLDYSKFPKCTAVPSDKNNEIILIRNITVKSLCEHHFMPVLGKAHIAYIPNKLILGLSKFNRITEFFSRRPQLQERLNEQIHAALAYVLNTKDVAVIIEAEHFCVKFRGIQDASSDTVTSKMTGKFFEVPEARSELMSLINRG